MIFILAILLILIILLLTTQLKKNYINVIGGKKKKKRKKKKKKKKRKKKKGKRGNKNSIITITAKDTKTPKVAKDTKTPKVAIDTITRLKIETDTASEKTPETDTASEKTQETDTASEKTPETDTASEKTQETDTASSEKINKYKSYNHYIQLMIKRFVSEYYIINHSNEDNYKEFKKNLSKYITKNSLWIKLFNYIKIQLPVENNALQWWDALFEKSDFDKNIEILKNNITTKNKKIKNLIEKIENLIKKIDIKKIDIKKIDIKKIDIKKIEDLIKKNDIQKIMDKIKNLLKLIEKFNDMYTILNNQNSIDRDSYMKSILNKFYYEYIELDRENILNDNNSLLLFITKINDNNIYEYDYIGYNTDILYCIKISMVDIKNEDIILINHANTIYGAIKYYYEDDNNNAYLQIYLVGVLNFNLDTKSKLEKFNNPILIDSKFAKNGYPPLFFLVNPSYKIEGLQSNYGIFLKYFCDKEGNKYYAGDLITKDEFKKINNYNDVLIHINKNDIKKKVVQIYGDQYYIVNDEMDNIYIFILYLNSNNNNICINDGYKYTERHQSSMPNIFSFIKKNDKYINPNPIKKCDFLENNQVLILEDFDDNHQAGDIIDIGAIGDQKLNVCFTPLEI